MLTYILPELVGAPTATTPDGTEYVAVVQNGVAKKVSGIEFMPRLTTTQRDALTATEGMLIYNTSTHKLNVRGASAWEAVTSA
jgi:hypothetical protein